MAFAARTVRVTARPTKVTSADGRVAGAFALVVQCPAAAEFSCSAELHTVDKSPDAG